MFDPMLWNYPGHCANVSENIHSQNVCECVSVNGCQRKVNFYLHLKVDVAV